MTDYCKGFGTVGNLVFATHVQQTYREGGVSAGKRGGLSTEGRLEQAGACEQEDLVFPSLVTQGPMALALPMYLLYLLWLRRPL